MAGKKNYYKKSINWLNNGWVVFLHKKYWYYSSNESNASQQIFFIHTNILVKDKEAILCAALFPSQCVKVKPKEPSY